MFAGSLNVLEIENERKNSWNALFQKWTAQHGSVHDKPPRFGFDDECEDEDPVTGTNSSRKSLKKPARTSHKKTPTRSSKNSKSSSKGAKYKKSSSSGSKKLKKSANVVGKHFLENGVDTEKVQQVTGFGILNEKASKRTPARLQRPNKKLPSEESNLLTSVLRRKTDKVVDTNKAAKGSKPKRSAKSKRPILGSEPQTSPRNIVNGEEDQQLPENVTPADIIAFTSENTAHRVSPRLKSKKSLGEEDQQLPENVTPADIIVSTSENTAHRVSPRLKSKKSLAVLPQHDEFVADAATDRVECQQELPATDEIVTSNAPEEPNKGRKRKKKLTREIAAENPSSDNSDSDEITFICEGKPTKEIEYIDSPRGKVRRYFIQPFD